MWQSEWVVQWVKTWENAKSYCAGLELWWYTDWRLPDITELLSIVDYTRNRPSVDTAYFNIASNNYWSSTTSANYTTTAWIVSFYNGNSSNYIKTTSYYVVCTR